MYIHKFIFPSRWECLQLLFPNEMPLFALCFISLAKKDAQHTMRVAVNLHLESEEENVKQNKKKEKN